MNKKLIFEASAYRDWSVIYCQIVYLDWVDEFLKQFNWRISDICFVWDGRITTLYRSPEEHLKGLFSFVAEKIKQDPQFLQKIAAESYKEAKECERFYNKVKNLSLKEISWKDFRRYFTLFLQKFVQASPKALIGVYFPQALELFPEKKKKYEEG
ncbi:hypothetical protein HY491_03565, partial [Candidatus Woesearchaeota archaeon]|nr:hypothetical protein [Candidatus Woesearchaeota archaeon]